MDQSTVIELMKDVVNIIKYCMDDLGDDLEHDSLMKRSKNLKLISKYEDKIINQIEDIVTNYKIN
jgi:hypothetical protein